MAVIFKGLLLLMQHELHISCFFTDLVLILAGFIKATHADVYIHECCIACIDIHTCARACMHTHTHTPILLVV